MSKNNSNLHKARNEKNDEFYTRREDIEKELKNYRPHFEGKVVFCNCDDPFESEFFTYFAINFKFLKLKKLIATCYNGSPISGMELPLWEDENDRDARKACMLTMDDLYDANGDGVIDKEDVKRMLLLPGHITRLEGNGSFDSPECLKILKESDIVVTNPPFSQFRKFVATMMKYDKKFLIIGSMNAITYKEIFPLIKENKLWLGNNSVTKFIQPDGSEKVFGNITWFTNLEHHKRNEKIFLYKKYNEKDYPKYDNFDAINVDKVDDIPCDYDGVMGVPKTFISQYCPDQFDIIGCADADIFPDGWKGMSKEFVNMYYKQGNTGQYKEGNRLAYYIKDGKAVVPFSRILIKKK